MKKFSVLAAIVFLCSCFWQIPVQAEGGRWTRFVSDSPSGYMYDELLYEEDGECEGIMVLGVCAFPNLSGIGMENYKVDYEIPTVVDGKTVIGIGKGIRDEFQRANTIIISDGIREIGEQAFSENEDLTIVLPDSIVSIADDAFASSGKVTFYCHPGSFSEQYAISKDIECITYGIGENLPILYDYEFLPDGTISISRYKQKNAEGTIIVPDEIDGYPVTEIAPLTFFWCRDCTSIIIPDGIKKIGANAFFCCDSLESISIPDSVTEIDPYAFDQNPGIHGIQAKGKVSIYCSSKSYAQKYAEKEDLNYVITDDEAEQSFLYKNRIPLLCVVLVCILCVGVTVAVILSRKRRQITACAEEEIPVNYCPSCGRKARPGDRYCRGCGKLLE
ncbi:MAG: leucine-rich repeat domain-containing protein [Lachnospiraceae bacterium]|nr:leucine-rich repeat domain-containing protein [Lachnospiraceae bacterium]